MSGVTLALLPATGAPGATVEVQCGRNGNRGRGETIIIIFEADRPSRRQSVLDTGADHSAPRISVRARRPLGIPACRELVRPALWRDRYVAVQPSATAFAIEERAARRVDNNADPAGHTRERLRRHLTIRSDDDGEACMQVKLPLESR